MGVEPTESHRFLDEPAHEPRALTSHLELQEVSSDLAVMIEDMPKKAELIEQIRQASSRLGSSEIKRLFDVFLFVMLDRDLNNEGQGTISVAMFQEATGGKSVKWIYDHLVDAGLLTPVKELGTRKKVAEFEPTQMALEYYKALSNPPDPNLDSDLASM